MSKRTKLWKDPFFILGIVLTAITVVVFFTNPFQDSLETRIFSILLGICPIIGSVLGNIIEPKN